MSWSFEHIFMFLDESHLPHRPTPIFLLNLEEEKNNYLFFFKFDLANVHILIGTPSIFVMYLIRWHGLLLSKGHEIVWIDPREWRCKLGKGHMWESEQDLKSLLIFYDVNILLHDIMTSFRVFASSSFNTGQVVGLCGQLALLGTKGAKRPKPGRLTI